MNIFVYAVSYIKINSVLMIKLMFYSYGLKETTNFYVIFSPLKFYYEAIRVHNRLCLFINKVFFSARTVEGARSLWNIS